MESMSIDALSELSTDFLYKVIYGATYDDATKSLALGVINSRGE